MLRLIHRGMLLSLAALLGILVGCRKENDANDPNGPVSNNPFDLLTKTRETNDRLMSQNNLKRIMLAMHNFESANASFPGMIFDRKDGKPLLSWRVAILPYLEEDNLAKRFKLDEPWDSPNNKALISQMPKVFAIPGISKPGDTETHYRVFVSPPLVASQYVAPFSLIGPPKGPQPLHIHGIIDGTSNTFAVVEAAEAATWTKPEGLEFDDKKPLPKFADFWKGSFNAGMFDGSVRSIPANYDEKELRKAISYRDGFVVNIP